jgi:glutamate-1-semialdehyde 2,1-aminomutase
MNHSKSDELFFRIEKRIPGGVNTSLRNVEPHLVFSWAKGARIRDVDGNEYVDYHLAFGPIILGHRDPDVEAAVNAVREQMDLVGVGTTELEFRLSDKISDHMPSAEKVLFCNSGSEATYAALRLARAVTKKKRIIKFQGCYHGWHDYVSMNVTSPAEKLGKYDPLSSGMLEEAMTQTSVLTINSMEEVSKCVSKYHGEIAAIIIEPIAHNIGCVPATDEFLHFLREISDREGIVFILDEIITGFRHALGGYQSICKVNPDLTTFGKAVANGYPMSGLAGRGDLMDRFATRKGGDVFFAGTFNAHPYSCAAALATINKLEGGEIHRRLYKYVDKLSHGIDGAAEESGIETYTAHFGSIFVTYFAKPPFLSYNDVLRSDPALFVKYRREMIEKGVFMLPVNAKRNFICAAHTEKDIEETIDKSRDVFFMLKQAFVAK